MLPITEPLKVRVVTLRANEEKFYYNGAVVRIGQEVEFPVAEAKGLERRGVATIIPGTERIVSQGLAPADPPATRRWNASKW